MYNKTVIFWCNGMDKTTSALRFPIRKLAERTGVAPTTLRAWERRYGLLKPERTPKGHRLYSDQDVRLVEQVLTLLKQGHAISEVARRVLSEPPAEALPSEPERSADANSIAQDAGIGAGQWSLYSARMLRAIEQFNQQQLDAVYNDASSLYPIDLVSRDLIEPVLQALGERWHQRDAGVAEEHFFLAWLRNKLGARLHHAAAHATGNVLVVACLPGHRHEIGTLMFALAALGRGYRLVYLGSDMPLEPILPVVERCHASGVVLSGGAESDDQEIVANIGHFTAALSCPVFVGGRMSVDYGDALLAAGAMPIGDQFALAVHLVTSRVPVHTSAGQAVSAVSGGML